jgi:hypothetical protein
VGVGSWLRVARQQTIISSSRPCQAKQALSTGVTWTCCTHIAQDSARCQLLLLLLLLLLLGVKPGRASSCSCSSTAAKRMSKHTWGCWMVPHGGDTTCHQLKQLLLLLLLLLSTSRRPRPSKHSSLTSHDRVISRCRPTAGPRPIASSSLCCACHCWMYLPACQPGQQSITSSLC